jgi:chemotaxis protein methyltransferase CheR
MNGTTVRSGRLAVAPAPLDPELGRAYRRLIEEHAGLRLTDHQARDLAGFVAELLATTTYEDAQALYGALATGARRDLIEALPARLTIGETHFFRVGPQIDALRTAVLPEIIGRRASQRRLRAWSAGCSTGEEPYTLAILIREQLAAPDGWDVQLLATDINEQALDAARAASYGDWSFRGTPDEVRRRYFAPDGRRWRLVESVRRMVRFAPMNLLADPIPSLQPEATVPTLGPTFDLILCRNVTIYFGPEAVQRVYQRFAEALADGGWLVLGPSDPVPAQPGPLEPTYVRGAVLWRRAKAKARGPALTLRLGCPALTPRWPTMGPRRFVRPPYVQHRHRRHHPRRLCRPSRGMASGRCCGAATGRRRASRPRS